MLSLGMDDHHLASHEFHQLRAFLAVAKHLSFSRAAEVLGITPSSLSQTVRNFEETVGTQLLHRTTRSVSLTEAGGALLERAAPAARELAAAVEQARRASLSIAGVVRVHAIRSASRKHIEPILARFGKRYPDVVIDLTVDDTVADLVAGGFDVALRVGEVIEKNMIAVKIGPELRQVAVATPEYIAVNGMPHHPRDLLQHRCIRWRWPGRSTPYAWEFFENGAWFDVVVDGPFIVDSREAALGAVLDSVGVGFVIEDTVTELLEQRRLVKLLDTWSAPFPGLHICYPDQRQMRPALRAFIDAIRSEA